MFLIFHTDKLPETHFLCLCHVSLTAVKFEVNGSHALMLHFIFVFLCLRLLQVFAVTVRSVGSRSRASLTLFLTLCLSISPLFNGCLSALMHVCHMTTIAEQCPVCTSRGAQQRMCKSFFWRGAFHCDSGKHCQQLPSVNKIAQ